jgi:hypothetical protein
MEIQRKLHLEYVELGRKLAETCTGMLQNSENNRIFLKLISVMHCISPRLEHKYAYCHRRKENTKELRIPFLLKH